MSWRDLLAPEGGEERVLPWLGGRDVSSINRTWAIQGKRPPEFGWFQFTLTGRKARLKNSEPQLADPDFEAGDLLTGYLVGDRFIPDGVSVTPDPEKLIAHTIQVYCVEQGLERFTRATVVRMREDKLVFLRMEWPTGPETQVIEAYQDRKESVTKIHGVIPALDLAFRWCSRQRLLVEKQAAEAERLRQAELAKAEAAEKMKEAMKTLGTGAGRRHLAQHDFQAAARAALAISGAELLDVRESYQRGEMVVQYRYKNRRLECTCDKKTLRIIDAGVCLDDHRGTKGDTYFTLESLPAVIQEAMNLGKLVVWRHAPGDRGYDDY